MRKVLSRLKLYIINWFLLLDLAINTLLGGSPRETLSSRMGKSREEGHCALCKWICNFLDLIDEDHCKKSIDVHRGDWTGAGKNRNVWR